MPSSFILHNLLTILLILTKLSFINLSGSWVLIHQFCQKTKQKKTTKIIPKNTYKKKHAS